MTLTAAGGPRTSRGVRVEVDRRPSHPEWDAWVAATPGGHHVQTSSWARVQAFAGWRAARVILSCGGEPVAGCQLLVRDLPPIGSVALSPRGPLLSRQAPELLDQILAAVRRVARDEGIVHLRLQPPVDGDDLAAQLRLRGLRLSDPQPAPVAGVRVDLSRYGDEDRVFAALPPTTRERVRQAQRGGLAVRAGGERDLPVLQRLLPAAAERQGAAQPPHDPRHIWEAFAPSGQATLQVAEHEGRALSASLLIAFGDTVVCEIGAQSRTRGAPPGTDEVMHWTAMRRAHADGFRYYDFGPTPIEVARAVLAPGEAPSDTVDAACKPGLAAEVVSLPRTYDLALGRVVGPLLSRATPSHWLPRVLRRRSGVYARPPAMEPPIWRWYDTVLTPRVLALGRRAMRALERSVQVRTGAVVALEEPRSSCGHDLGYEPSPWMTLRRILKRRDVTSGDVFVDFGAGMGRVLYQAALRYPFRRVEGVELEADLTAVAQENLDRARHRLRCRDIRFVTCDAVAYEIPDDLTIAYLFNPFQGPIFRAVVERLLESVERRPRRLRLIYVNPVEERALLDAGFREVRRLRGVQPGRWHARMYELTAARSRRASDSPPSVS
ncbi:MAG TPA: peptidoglycan bridge formation glycyltransferase FemA/FemB family protein [Solirubrobacteraceae bacterium]|nr:peptidoglycan bridge formation glycyltransferase FemA/FemB family protein [Solirubrobacteraceae bacterium]